MGKANHKKNITDDFLITNHQYYFEAEPHEISSVMPAKEWAKLYVADHGRGFKKEPFFFKFFRKSASIFIKICEEILGSPLYIKADDQDFLKIEPRFKKIITELKEDGIISAVYRQKFRPDWPVVPYYHVCLNPVPKPDGGHVNLVGSLSGSNLDSNEALAAALAETIERHALCYWSHKKITRGSFEELCHKGAVDPLVFKVFSEKQLENPEYKERHCFNHETIFDWIEAQALIAGKKCLVPAQLIYIGYGGNTEPMIRHDTTSGAGAGECYERAVYSAVCEAIERDAFLIFWLNKITPPQIDEATIRDENIKKVLNNYRRHNIEIKIFDITSDVGIPTFLVLSIDRSGKGPAVHVSAAADLDSEKAVLHALLENIKIGAGMMQFMARENFKRVNSIYPNFRSMRDRGLWWAQLRAVKEIEWLVQDVKNPMPPNYFQGKNYKEKLEALKEKFKNSGHEIYIADITSPVAQKYGLCVAMSLIPGFYPLYLSEHYRGLGVERLYNLPVKLGYFDKPKKEEEINQMPHPML